MFLFHLRVEKIIYKNKTIFHDFSTTLLWSVMLMALHPDVQKKCQNELDETLGEKPPTMDDMNNLNYIMATINEIMRFSMVAEGSLPHRLTKDMEVDGYKFKKDTLFISNLAKFLNDPVQFPEPRKFKPERFLGKDGNVQKHDYLVPFGIGKRICMGESLAKNELFIFFARVIQRINIGVTNGRRPDAEEYFSGITRIPKPYDVSVSARI